MLQREVADRLVARPATKDYGVLTVLTAAPRADRRACSTCRRARSSPPPKVRSTRRPADVRAARGPHLGRSAVRADGEGDVQSAAEDAGQRPEGVRRRQRPTSLADAGHRRPAAAGDAATRQKLHGLRSVLARSERDRCAIVPPSFPACISGLSQRPIGPDTCRAGSTARPRRGCASSATPSPAHVSGYVEVASLLSDDDAVREAPPVDVIPLGGLGEFGMNMLLVACGDTAVLVDAGVMFPEPELFGVDLVIPDLTALEPYRGRIAALVLTHGHEDHIGAIAHVIDAGRRPGLRLAVHARARRAEARGTRHRRCATASVTVTPRADGRRRPVPHRVPARHAQHPGLPGARHPHAGRHRSSTPATSRSTRRRSTASPSTCIGSPSSAPQGVLALLLGQHERRPARVHGLGTRGHRRLRRGLQQRAPGKIVVAAFSTSVYRLQLLVDLAEQFERKVAFVGRGMQHISQIARAARLPADAARPADPRQRRPRLPRPGRAVPLHRLAGRAAGGPAPHRHRRPPARQARTGGRRRVLGPGHSRQREGRRPGHEPRRPARAPRSSPTARSTSTSPGTAARKS